MNLERGGEREVFFYPMYIVAWHPGPGEQQVIIKSGRPYSRGTHFSTIRILLS
jgi:hypothetical protein